MKNEFGLVVGAIVVVAGIFGAVFLLNRAETNLGAAYPAATVTATSTSVFATTSTLWGTQSGLSGVYLKNTGGFNAFCSFGVNNTAVLNQGFVLSTGTLNAVFLDDQSLLKKPANCIAVATTSISQLREF